MPSARASTCRAMADAIRHNATLQEFVSNAIGTSIANESSRAMTDAVNRPRHQRRQRSPRQKEALGVVAYAVPLDDEEQRN